MGVDVPLRNTAPDEWPHLGDPDHLRQTYEPVDTVFAIDVVRGEEKKEAEPWQNSVDGGEIDRAVSTIRGQTIAR